ncbi:HxlR family transcriptional regulator [Actinomycetospora succinea]|uniref:HxlR family transcriptional regulator n=1 Tax=Actinomycetospora succinea TaxID=663603 RepID=A0A4R6VS77_9PSEU|nr:helix-turn-helix domain-containing protein [Actinomycetospora succinea]TDQ62750.1 HxlR family transcriptional regulator [Actinomycetospora succinea]
MPLGQNYDRQDCALARALEIVGERWTLLVLRDCFFGVRRFADLRAHLDIPRAVLSDRLATLVDAGLLARRNYAPGRDEYVLTDTGLDLWPAVYSLARFGDRHLVGPGGGRRRFRHADCPEGGAELAAGAVCPACGTLPAPSSLETYLLVPAADTDRPVRDDAVSVALRRPHRLLAPLP